MSDPMAQINQILQPTPQQTLENAIRALKTQRGVKGMLVPMRKPIITMLEEARTCIPGREEVEVTERIWNNELAIARAILEGHRP